MNNYRGFAYLAALLLAVITSTPLSAADAKAPMLSRSFGPLELKASDGTAAKLADYNGKVVLVQFWSVKSASSTKALSNLKAIHDRQIGRASCRERV